MRTEEVRTPFFLVREDLLSGNIRDFRTALETWWPNSVLACSVKTNALPWILRKMLENGVSAEVVSDEEYELAGLCGYTDEKMVFNGPVKSPGKLAQAFAGGAVVNLDSAAELEWIRKNRPAVNGKIGLRINVDPAIFDEEDVGYREDGFRFGFCEENGSFARALETLREQYGDLRIGLHMHVNSVTRSLRVYRALARYAAGIIRKYNLDPGYIDIGGGFFGGVPGKTTPGEYIRAIREELEGTVNPDGVLLIAEPGSALTGSAVELHTSVTDVKDTARARIVTTDGSRIHIDPLWLKKNYLTTVSTDAPAHPRQVICGYTCMDHDRITVLENRPELAAGDRIVYHRVGNYTVTFGGPFIRPFPPVYAGTGGEIRLVRRAMTMKEYYRMETADE